MLKRLDGDFRCANVMINKKAWHIFLLLTVTGLRNCVKISKNSKGGEAGMDSFQLKADLMPITTLRLLNADASLLQSQLEKIILKAPNYFTNAPVIVDFTAQPEANATEVCALLRQYRMQPIAARGLENQNQDVLPNISANQTAPKTPEKTTPKTTARMITKTIRSGTQIYAKNQDLVILSTVNVGAEVIADGNIHVYGSLRGRALAGASGDKNARIFCKGLDAELVAIAGHYLINETIKARQFDPNDLVQIFLNNDCLAVEIL